LMCVSVGSTRLWISAWTSSSDAGRRTSTGPLLFGFGFVSGGTDHTSFASFTIIFGPGVHLGSLIGLTPRLAEGWFMPFDALAYTTTAIWPVMTTVLNPRDNRPDTIHDRFRHSDTQLVFSIAESMANLEPAPVDAPKNVEHLSCQGHHLRHPWSEHHDVGPKVGITV